MEILRTLNGTIVLIPQDGKRAENVYFIGPYSVEYFPFIDAFTEILLPPNVYIFSYEYKTRLLTEKHSYTLVILPVLVDDMPEHLQQMVERLKQETEDVETLRKLYNKFIKEYDDYRKQ